MLTFFRLLHLRPLLSLPSSMFFFNDTATTDIYTLSLHDALPIWRRSGPPRCCSPPCASARSSSPPPMPRPSRCRSPSLARSEEHTSELQSLRHLVCRLLLEKKKTEDRKRKRLTSSHICISSAFFF